MSRTSFIDLENSNDAVEINRQQMIQTPEHLSVGETMTWWDDVPMGWKLLGIGLLCVVGIVVWVSLVTGWAFIISWRICFDWCTSDYSLFSRLYGSISQPITLIKIFCKLGAVAHESQAASHASCLRLFHEVTKCLALICLSC